MDQNIEGIILNVPTRATVLQCIEAHPPLVIDHHYFTIDECIRWELLAGTGDLGKPHSESSSSSRPKNDTAGPIGRKAAIAVELGFVKPVTPIGQRTHEGELHRLDKARADALQRMLCVCDHGNRLAYRAEMESANVLRSFE